MAAKQKTMLGLTLGTLGVVFGDIGTSPLYAVKVLFGLSAIPNVHSPQVVYGLISMVLWTITLIVSIKYVGMVMRASNNGEGGIMALVAMISGTKTRYRTALIVIGLLGVALFYGDSVVTPAISVLSAVEGLQVVAPAFSSLVIPITLLALAALFAIQRYGTAAIGKLFGPIMLAWFASLAVAGAWQVTQHPAILNALSPLQAASFIAVHPWPAFVSMGAIVLAVTGVEAMYADMGHFGRDAVSRTWFLIVFPALALCYLGQGALVLRDPAALSNPFYLMFPESVRLPMILLATAATLIASQAVIVGAFSLTRQAIQLGYLPRMVIKQTSATNIGQIYIPFVNFILLLLVAMLVITFGTSQRLAGAYGVAVSGALLVDSILFAAAMRVVWLRSRVFVELFLLSFVTLDVILVLACAPKVLRGGWLPLTIAVLVLLMMNAWIVGRRVVTKQRRAMEPPLQDYITSLQSADKAPVRVEGQAVYIGHHPGLTPMALRTAAEEIHELHQKAVIVYVKTASVPHVPVADRVEFDSLDFADGICQVIITYGFHDTPNVPKTLASVRKLDPELDFDPQKAVYFISLSRTIFSDRGTMMGWQKALYAAMSRNALSASDYYNLPIKNTVEMRTLIKI